MRVVNKDGKQYTFDLNITKKREINQNPFQTYEGKY